MVLKCVRLKLEESIAKRCLLRYSKAGGVTLIETHAITEIRKGLIVRRKGGDKEKSYLKEKVDDSGLKGLRGWILWK